MWQVYLSIAFLGFACILMLRATILHWNGPDPRFAKAPIYWVWGEALWRGTVRAWLAIEIGLALALLMGLYVLVVGSGNVRNDVSIGWFICVVRKGL